MIHEARSKKADLTVVLLLLANAYGSIPYDLIRTALKHYHLPNHIKEIISSYLQGLKLHFRMKDYITVAAPGEAILRLGVTWMSHSICGWNFMNGF